MAWIKSRVLSAAVGKCATYTTHEDCNAAAHTTMSQTLLCVKSVMHQYDWRCFCRSEPHTAGGINICSYGFPRFSLRTSRDADFQQNATPPSMLHTH